MSFAFATKLIAPSDRLNLFYVFIITLFLLAMTSLLSPRLSYGFDNSVFTVRDIQIDITSKSAANARQQAQEQAQEIAFDRLKERILRADDAAALINPEAKDLRRLVQDFEIRNEKLSSVRYKANFVVRFQEDAVRSYLDTQGVSYTDVGSKPVLVLPFFQNQPSTPGQVQMTLWGGTNPWLAAWSKAEGNQGLVPVTVPLGDLSDVQNIGDQQALTYDPEKLAKMIERYNAGEAIILIASQSSQDVGNQDRGAGPLSVFIYSTDANQPEFVKKVVLSPQTNEARSDLFGRAVDEIFELLQQNWKNRTIVDPDQQNTLRVKVAYRSLNEWANIKKSLSDVQGLLNIKYLSISPLQAQIQFFFKGSEQRLRLALAQEDMALSKPRVNLASLLEDNNRKKGGDSPLLYELKLK